jgi:SAM-dependent methyltransferase
MVIPLFAWSTVRFRYDWERYSLWRHSPGSFHWDSGISDRNGEWNQRAGQNGRHYVATGQEKWTDAEFFDSGRTEVEAIITPEFQAICNGREPGSLRILEIGCGAGRMTRTLSRFFGEVAAVDISSEMITLAKSALGDCTNVEFHVNNGFDLSAFPDEHFDFAISAIVFQHIPKRVFIENYIRETWRVLKRGSIFKFQVQGHQIDESEADTWVGVGFSEEQMRDIARTAGFTIKNSTGAGTQYYWLTFLKP